VELTPSLFAQISPTRATASALRDYARVYHRAPHFGNVLTAHCDAVPFCLWLWDGRDEFIAKSNRRSQVKLNYVETIF